MKKIKLLLYTLMLFITTGCSSFPTGKYYITSMEFSGQTLNYNTINATGSGDSIFLEFDGDNTAIFYQDGNLVDITLDSKTNTFTNNGEVINYTINGNIVKIYNSTIIITFAREGSNELKKIQSE